MSQWEEITDDDSSPFAATGKVDGIVYAEQESSPELAFQAGAYAPPPPVPYRPEPIRPPQHTSAAPWKPGGDLDPAAFRPKPHRTNPVKVFVLGMIPIILAVSLVFVVMNLYGDVFH